MSEVSRAVTPAGVANRPTTEHTLRRRASMGIVLVAVCFGAASAQAQQGLDGSPAHREAENRFHLATEAFDLGDFASSLREWERVYALLDGHPNRAYVLYNMARANEELGRAREALELYERFLRDAGPEAPTARTHIGMPTSCACDSSLKSRGISP